VNRVILDKITFRIDHGGLLKSLHIEEGSTYADDLRRLASDAQGAAKPRALYTVAFIESRGDVLHRYWADVIKEQALRRAIRALNEDLSERYRPGRTSAMSPGSLEDWPLEEQRALFAILGNPEDAIGVRLSDSFLMVPTKSVSGIGFPTEQTFESCQLCPRQNCPGRRSPYDEGLYERRYRRGRN
jgi:hypothetical protein